MKRLFSVVLATCLVISLLQPPVATATSADCPPGALFSTVTGQPCSATTAATTSTTTQTPANTSCVPLIITRTLTIGSRGTDVTKLQQFLRLQGDFSYPSYTTTYGSVTAAAVRKFQARNGISQTGSVGPITRAKIQQLSCNGSTTTTQAEGFTRNLTIGSSGADVKALQVFLNKSTSTRIALTGAGSLGLETTYYGAGTAAAVKKYQAINKLPVTGVLDLATRTFINKIILTSTGNGNGNTGTGGVVVITGGGGGGSYGGGGGGGNPTPTTYTINATAGDGGSVNPGGTISVNQGSSQTITFTPATGYQIATVVIDGVSIGVGNSYTFTNITSNHTLSVTFTQIPVNPTTYTITATASVGGAIAPLGASTVTSGTDKTYTITPNSGYQIASVVVNGNSVGTPNTYTFNNVTGNQTISATFSQIPVPTYTVTSSAGANGTISPLGTNSINQGLSATYTITPDAGYQVASVTVDGANQGAITSYTFPNTTTGSHTISATFAAVQQKYTITASAGTGGSVGPSGTISVNQGTSQTFTITPATGYRINQVLVDGANQGAVTTYTFPSNSTGSHTISATFTLVTYTITASASANGTISPNGTITVNSGSTQNFSVTPNTGYQISQVLVDGVSQAVASTYSFSNVNANHTIAVTFSQVTTTNVITSLTLVNTDTQTDIRNLNSTDSIDLGTLPTKNLNIRANIGTGAQSVTFGYDGNANYRTESSAPLAFASDINNVYQPWTPTVGNHTITATPYSATGGTGTAGTVFTIALTVTDSSSNPVSTKFSIGDRVQVTSTVNVRATASPTGTLNGSQTTGALGSVVGGPTAAGGFNWWQINYDTGADGWSIEDNLVKDTTTPDTTAPIISAISSSNVSSTGATISWTTNEAADTQVEYGVTTSYGSQTTLVTTKTTSHSVALSGLTAATTYHYRVKSKDAAGNLATSLDQTFTTTAPDTQAPTVPTNLTATAASGSIISLTWSPSTDNVGVTGYRIYRNGASTPVATVTTNAYSDTGLTAATTYTYTVAAIDAAGNASAQSASKSATTQNVSTSGNTYYVATTGSDSANGSNTTPWKTMQKAMDSTKPGDTVIVRAGTYQGMNGYTGATLGGTASAPITFLADPGVILNRLPSVGVNANLAIINLENTSGNYIIKGFTVDGTTANTQRAGIRFVNCPNCKILNNTIHHSYIGIHGSYATNMLIEGNIAYSATDQHGIYVATDFNNSTVRGNTLYNNNWDGLHMNTLNGNTVSNNIIENNVIHDNNLSGMDLEGISFNTYRNNLIYNNTKHGITIHSQDQANTPVSKSNAFINNTIYNNGLFGAQIQGPDMQGETFFNNIFITNNGTYGAIGTNGSPSGLKSDYNIVADNFSTNGGVSKMTLAQWSCDYNAQTCPNGTGNDKHSIIAAASTLFVNAPTDFHLKNGAPAIDAGTSFFNGYSAPNVDYTGGTRPQGNGYDMGAYESGSIGTPTDTQAPSVPANLSASSASLSSIAITWSASTDNTGVAGYKLYRNGSLLTTTSNTSYTDTGLTTGTTYTYSVAAFDNVGNTSAQSNSVSASPAPDTQAPTVPSNVSASALSSSQIAVSWSASSDNAAVTGYKVYRNGTQVTTTSNTSFTDSSLTAATTYSYTVAAYDAAGNTSLQSSNTFATTLDAGSNPVSIVAVDASSPARVTTTTGCSTSAGSTQAATASFTAPAGALVIATVNTDGDVQYCGRNPSVTISGGGQTWTNIATESGANGGTGGLAGAWYANATGSSMTVTANVNVTGTISLKVYVVTGASGIGATGRGSSSTGNLTTTAYTSIAANSLGFAVGTDWSATAVPTSGDVADGFISAGNISGVSVYKSANTVSAGTPVSFNLNSGGSSASWNWVIFEVKPATVAFSGTSIGKVAGVQTTCVVLSNRLILGSSDASTNGEVSMLQTFLKTQGDYTYPEITGYYGAATAAAVQAFQARNGLEPVGEVGPLTSAKIQSISCGN